MKNVDIDSKPNNTDSLAAQNSSEFQRFLILYDWLMKDSAMWIEATPEEQLDWVPIDNKNVSFGDRVTKVTNKSLFVHMLVAADVWIRETSNCEKGAVIPVASDKELTQKLNESNLLETAKEMHESNMVKLRSFKTSQIDKKICFPSDKSNWTVMGFLWAMYGHHAFHLGNLDIYVRQGDNVAPDLFTFDPREMA